ncbi:hypothetical protein H6G76_27920 [Nostoc sp. FACHB-152]|uniref:hypothetical protein n=1 Tax=unclassified Nostoc TaxID=2593658 RepID=UPI001688547F|nr:MULTISPECIES: hypothetical protein [unclassified Nostoc]MBD2450887.1 hypothetical protein [Nostoc sp. FACHB-152]MBD2470077.1 hypothetical protein [Nostoc sp. FACHB-145]
MESQNPEQLTLDNRNELSENLNLSEAIAVNENHDTTENNSLDSHSSLETSLNQINDTTVEQQDVELPSKRTKKGLCWSEPLQKMVPC